MKRLFLLAIFILCMVPAGMAQTYSVTGNVTDTLNNIPLFRASIVLIRKSDSVIQTFARADASGNFTLKVPAKGKYIIQATFPGFADYVEVMDIKEGVTNLGKVPMVTREHILEEFVIKKQMAAIKMKGDTTEYVADSFKTKENATVEDLLKKLPGIQVDRNGQITAQGETVQKVLVDGEEFFSDDPKVVTQGLQAVAVDKVQVFNKKSDQAEFTGIDDGQKTKTINLELKEDRKKGYFGKIDAGGGTGGYFQDQGMINMFKGKKQIAAFGIMSNTDKVGLNWQDNDKFGGDANTVIGDDGGFVIYGNNDDNFGGWNGKYNGEGLPKVWTGGAHFADKWNEDKNHVTGNYRYFLNTVEADGNTITQYSLKGDTSNVNNQQKSQFSRGEKHGLDAMYEWKPDTATTFKLSLGGGTKNASVTSGYNTAVSQMAGGEEHKLYTNSRRISSKSDADFLNIALSLKRKFAKKGRTLSIDVKENEKDSKSDGYLNSVITPDTANAVNAVIDQQKKNNSSTLALNAKAIYTEPLSKITFLEFSYGATVNNTSTENFSYNRGGTGDYNALDSAFSSNYKYNILSNAGGMYFRWSDKKLNFSAGSDVTNTRYSLTDLLHGDTSHTYNYLNLFPKAAFKYKFSRQSSISVNYNGSTQQPTINQVQPLKQNTDPTNILIGNPALRQSFTHSFNGWANDYRVLKDRWIYAGGNFSFVKDAISTQQFTREGINTLQYINVNGNYSGSSWVGYGLKIKKLDINFDINFSANTSHSENYINGLKNINNNNSYTGGLRFSRYKEDKYEFSLEPKITYNDNRATINTSVPSYWSSESQADGSVQLPKKFEIGTDVHFIFRQPTAVFTSNNTIIRWNAYAGKKFLKSHELELKISVFDILNQNIGFTRTAQAGILTQNSYSTIRRYGMISLVWNFTYKPAVAAAAAN
jgi:hypothetical protein